MITNILAFIIVLGVLVFFHEFGHFIVARFFRVGVEKFSFGFGPRLFGKKVGRTDYLISAIPLGGYVKMVGEDPEDEIKTDDIPFSFTNKHVFKKMLIVAAGPFFNFLLAVIIFFGIFYASGILILKPTVGKVNEKSPAEIAGIKQGDLIVQIDKIKISTWEDMSELISKSNGKSLDLSVLRNGEIIKFNLIPKKKKMENIFGEGEERYLVGIAASNDFYKKKLSPTEALSESVKQTFNIVNVMLVSIEKLALGSISSKDMGLGGPIMIAQMAGDQAKRGAVNLIFFIALLSINLAILNFLPIPILDGGHLLLFFIEFIIRRPINLKIKQTANKIGLSLLMLLMIYVCYSDIVRVFFH